MGGSGSFERPRSHIQTPHGVARGKGLGHALDRRCRVSGTPPGPLQASGRAETNGKRMLAQCHANATPGLRACRKYMYLRYLHEAYQSFV